MQQSNTFSSDSPVKTGSLTLDQAGLDAAPRKVEYEFTCFFDIDLPYEFIKRPVRSILPCP